MRFIDELNLKPNFWLGASIFDLNHIEKIALSTSEIISEFVGKVPNTESPLAYLISLWLNGNTNYRTDWRILPIKETECFIKGPELGLINTKDFFNDNRQLDFILSHMRWYNDQRITEIPEYDYGADLYDQKIIFRDWLYSPIHIRYYAVFKSNNNKIPDILYLIGGSKEIFENKKTKNIDFVIDNLNNILKLLKGLGIKSLYERKGTIDKEIPIHTISFR